MVQLAV
ncbi:hypothetical protein YPPY66_2230, partial [Yersinia pestis PY-66]